MAVDSLNPHVQSVDYLRSLQKRRQLLLLGGLFGLSLVLARLVLAIDFGAVAAVGAFIVLLAVATRPRYGLYLLLAITFFFDNTGGDPIMLPGHYLNASLQSTLKIPGAILIPFEMLLLLTSVLWFAQAAMRRQVAFQAGSLGRPVLIFAACMMFGVLRGITSNANFNIVFWESRFLFSMILVYLLTTNTIRERSHVRTLLSITFIFVFLSVLEGLFRKFALINQGLMGEAQESWYSHDGMVFWGMLVVLLAVQLVVGAPRWMRILGPPALMLTLLAMLVSERRAGLVALAIGFAFFLISLITIKRKAFFAIGIPVALAVLVYLPLFWNNTGTLGQGARAIRSISSPDARDASSNAWRDLEAINVRATIASDPIFGLGFGKPFLQIVTVPDISGFEFWNYEAHHNVLWVWMKLGGIGFIAFFSVILLAIARAIWLARTLPDRESKTFALLAMAAIVMSMVFCYVDLGLTGSRITMILGLAIGTVAVLDRLPRDANAVVEPTPVARRR
jgi:hypothetical protein